MSESREGRADRAHGRLRAIVAGRRGSAQLGLLVAAAAVAGGMTIGNGVASHNASSGYDLAWLADGRHGQVIQVDPVLGRSDVRLQVASPGGDLEVQQGNGQLVVIDRRTGKITSINLGTLLVGGTRAEPAGNAVKLLLAGGHMYVVNLANGTVQAVDPATQANIGTPWSAGHPLIDVGIDGQQNIWALDSTNRLVALHWTAPDSTLTTVSERSVAGTGAGSVIVGHDQGVTVVGAGGTILQVGTGHDSQLTAPQVKGPLDGPRTSPDGLVPVSDPGSSAVVIVNQGSAVVDDVSGLGCPNPGAPTVFDGKIYVPCLGSQQVIVLDAGGQPAGPPVPVPPGGDPQLTVSGGQLLIDVPGSGTATVIDSGGDAHQFPTYDPSVGTQDPSTPPPPPPPPPPVQPPQHHGHRGDTPQHGNGGDGGHGHSGDGQPSSGASGTSSAPPSGGSSSPSAPASGSSSPPGGVGSGTATAAARPDGSVLVSWTGPDAKGGFVVTIADTGQQVADVPTGATSATVTVLSAGTTATLLVSAYADHGRQHLLWTATANPVTVLTPPGAVSGVQTSVVAQAAGVAQLTVSWAPAAGNGGTVSYAVDATGSSTTTTTTTTSTQIEVPCPTAGCSGTVTVTPSNSAGNGPAAQATYNVASSVPPPSTPPTTPPPPSSSTPAATSTPPSSSTPPPPPAPPAGGLTMIHIDNYVPGDSNNGDAEVDLTVTMPGDWQAWSGSCQLQDNGVAVQNLTCSQATTSTSLYYARTGTHVYTVVASGSGSATSASVTQRVVYRITCIQSAGARSLTGGPSYELPMCGTCQSGSRTVQCMPPFVAPRAVGGPAAGVARPASSDGSPDGSGAPWLPVTPIVGGATLTALLVLARRWWHL